MYIKMFTGLRGPDFPVRLEISSSVKLCPMSKALVVLVSPRYLGHSRNIREEACRDKEAYGVRRLAYTTNAVVIITVADSPMPASLSPEPTCQVATLTVCCPKMCYDMGSRSKRNALKA